MIEAFAKQGATFAFDWFSRHVPLWKVLLAEIAAQPIRILEIGVFEGRSTLWLMENVARHPESRLFYVDTFQGSAEHAGNLPSDLAARFAENLAAHRARLVGFHGRSFDGLRQLSENFFDFIHIDGSHTAPDVLSDAVLSWPLLKAGGLLAFDDYEWSEFPDPRQCPKLAVDAFLAVHHGTYDVVHKGYQVWIRKR
jgi:predicted O-methyltransferase YrrM